MCEIVTPSGERVKVSAQLNQKFLQNQIETGRQVQIPNRKFFEIFKTYFREV